MNVFQVVTPDTMERWYAARTFKNKGSSNSFNHYRDIMLGDCSGMHIVKTIRKNVMPVISSILGNSQIGSGFNGGRNCLS